ncbi:putative DD34D transposase [Trichonephila clavipes]|uniref:Putative DD34D transposase n=1 Tax=Trichonephila clavipes TaxID=2585209 RepID=A0A8X6SK85_TRICX|nr:putative DD34D transposase [Trichonephila clavipes]
MQQSIEQRSMLWSIKFYVRLGKLGVSTLEMIQRPGERGGRAPCKSPVNIKNLRKRTTCATFAEHGLVFKCSHGRRTARNGDKMAVHKIISEDLGMRKICAKLEPKVLTDVQMQIREAISKDLLERIEEDSLFDNVITGEKKVGSLSVRPQDKTSEQRMAHSVIASPRRKKARMSKSRMKAMMTVFFDKNGVVYSEFVPEGQTVNGAFYVEVLKGLKRRVNRHLIL